MKLQYISDSDGITTGVFIPISEWNEMKAKYLGIEEDDDTIPGWHRKMVLSRLDDYQQGLTNTQDFDSVLDKIEQQS
jgi:hypothetical protein